MTALKGLVPIFVGVFLAGAVLPARPGDAASPPIVKVRIDISAQTMLVNVNGRSYARWKVSTARRGHYTPRGNFRPYLLKKMHYSSKYENSPMPHSIFYRGDYAIHGTDHVRSLGRPASHGCIRLAPGSAAKLFSLVRKHGMKATRISITN